MFELFLCLERTQYVNISNILSMQTNKLWLCLINFSESQWFFSPSSSTSPGPLAPSADIHTHLVRLKLCFFSPSLLCRPRWNCQNQDWLIKLYKWLISLSLCITTNTHILMKLKMEHFCVTHTCMGKAFALEYQRTFPFSVCRGSGITFRTLEKNVMGLYFCRDSWKA